MVINPNEYLTGMPLIDNQHKQYISLVDKLVSDHNEGKLEKTALLNSVNKTIAYGLEHLDVEEYLMGSEGYPLYEEHFAKHDIFRDKMDDFLAELDAKEIDIGDYVNRLSSWLIDWFQRQELNDDVKLAKFLKGKNCFNA